MKTIYLDSDFKCHIKNDGNMISVETDVFENKCDTYIEGYRFVPKGYKWTRKDGHVFVGEMIAPFKDYKEIDIAQREYEQKLIREQAATIAELDAALLDATYENIVGGVE